MGQDRLGFAQGRWDAGDPFRTRLSELLEIFGTVEGTVGDQESGAIGDLQLRDMVSDELAEVLRITAIATERLHQHRNTGLVFNNQVEHHLVEVRSLIPTIAAGDVNDVLIGLLITVVAAIDMKARAIEVGKAGRQSQALGRSRGNEAVECRHPIGVERIQSTAERVIIEMARLNAWGNEARDGLIVEKMGHEVELLIEKAQAVKDHGFDRMTYSHNPHFRVLLGGSINDFSDAEFFKHPRDQAQVI